MKYVNPTSDLAFKKVLGSNENIHILAGFINDFFFIKPDNLVVENPYSIKAYRELVKNQDTFRLRPTVSDVAAVMDFADYRSELQLRRGNFYDERSLYYPLDKFVGRYKIVPNEESRYMRLRPIYAMNILGYNHFPDDNDALRIFQLYDPVRNKSFPKNLINFAYFELQKTNIETQNQKYWQDYFLRKPLPQDAPDYIRSAMQIIDRSNMDKEELDMLTYTEYLQSIYDDQLAYARDEGHAEGHAEGRTEAVSDFIIKLLKRNIPIEEIMEYTGCTRAQIEAFV